MLRFAPTILALLGLACASLPALAQAPPPADPATRPATPAPADARLYFIAPKDGARLRGPVLVQFGLRNMGVTQAGVTTPNTGHHHILINKKDPINPDETIPADRVHVHFGGGQTETTLELPPGRHTLQLILGDADHRPFKPMVISEKIEVTVLAPQRRPRRARQVRSRFR